MPDDQETVRDGEVAPYAAARPGPGAAIAAHLLARTRAELPVADSDGRLSGIN